MSQSVAPTVSEVAPVAKIRIRREKAAIAADCEKFLAALAGGVQKSLVDIGAEIGADEKTLAGLRIKLVREGKIVGTGTKGCKWSLVAHGEKKEPKVGDVIPLPDPAATDLSTDEKWVEADAEIPQKP